jgi:hypothetical protein
MNIITQTQLQKDTLTIQNATDRALRSVVAAKDELNRAYQQLWSLPDDRLRDVLRLLLAEGKLNEVFTNHYIAATALNSILTNVGYNGEFAKSVLGREFVIDEAGVLDLVALPEPIEENPIEEPIEE